MCSPEGVAISDGYSRLALLPAGAAGVGFPTRIELSSGPFSVAVEAEARCYELFCNKLSALHNSLTGEARLEFWNEAHCLVFSGDGRGRIDLTIKVTDTRMPWVACLTVKMVLDQSYLPGIIESIGRTFATP